MTIRQNFTGYVLAGGKSSRMGADKAFLEIGGKTFLQNSFDALAPNCESVKIVLNNSQNHFIEKLPAGAGYVFDKFENRGAVGGIHAALTNCETNYAVILAIDLPFVSSPAIENLLDIVQDLQDFSAIVPRQIDDRLQPLCAVYRVADCLPKLTQMLLKNDSISAKYFLENIKIKTISATELSIKENLFANINSPNDFKNIKAKFA